MRLIKKLFWTQFKEASANQELVTKTISKHLMQGKVSATLQPLTISLLHNPCKLQTNLRASLRAEGTSNSRVVSEWLLLKCSWLVILLLAGELWTMEWVEAVVEGLGLQEQCTHNIRLILELANSEATRSTDKLTFDRVSYGPATTIRWVPHLKYPNWCYNYEEISLGPTSKTMRTWQGPRGNVRSEIGSSFYSGTTSRREARSHEDNPYFTCYSNFIAFFNPSEFFQLKCVLVLDTQKLSTREACDSTVPVNDVREPGSHEVRGRSQTTFTRGGG